MKFSLLFRNSATSFFIKIYGAIISLLVVVVAARFMSTRDFGLFAFYISLSGFFAYLSAFGQEQILIKKSRFFKSKSASPIILGSSFAVVLIASAFFVSIFVVLWWLDFSAYGASYLLCAATVPLVALRRLHVSVFRNHGFTEYCILAESIVYPTVLIILSICYFVISDLHSVKGYFFIVFMSVFFSVLFNLKLAKILGVVLYRVPSFKSLKKNMNLAIPFVLFSLTEAMSTFADKMLLAYIAGPEQLAIIHVVLRIAALSLFFESAVLLSTLSSVSSNFSNGNISIVQGILRNQSCLISGFYALFAIVCFFCADTILSLFGAEYHLGKDILVLSSFGLALNSLFGCPSFVMTVTNMENQAYKINLFFLILYLILIPVVYFKFGLYFVVFLKVVVDIFRVSYCWVFLRRSGNVDTSVFSVLKNIKV